ncbi:hypothetical protein [Aurantiacibacter sp. MUD61]|uniref:hypothetical protein n=1 Tax=Aurantiacibacter sp. MUD61 TaxID=3009083 RepID=UPI0022EFFA43|nr:hypothetical protein [Aurantiacibacter sp. MUD61]
MGFTNTIRNHLWASGTFIAICLIGLGARWAIGDVYSGAEATQLIEALSRAGLYLGSAITTASATTLALMLTLIGMIRKIDRDFDDNTYRSIDMVAKLATASMMISLIVLLAFTLPVGEFEEMPQNWYVRMYDGLFTACVLMVGLIASTVIVLYRTVRGVITVVTPGDKV